MGPGDLTCILSQISFGTHPDVLVGLEHSDDAAVYRMGEQAIVATADYITAIVDDPFTFGRIAATNSLSDVYAMGGEPLFALNLVMYPTKSDPLDRLKAILEGGAAAAKEAGIPIVGGHSVCDAETKYGMAVIGKVDPQRVWRNAGMRDGDALVLTKALGTGAVARAVRKKLAPEATVTAAVASMTRLNREARDRASREDVHACTDITGFGLAGHLTEMCAASRARVRIDLDALPVLPGAWDLLGAMEQAAANAANWRYAEPLVTREGAPLSVAQQRLLADPQTSGGLLIALAPEAAQEVAADLRASGHAAAVIGRVDETACAPGITVTGKGA